MKPHLSTTTTAHPLSVTFFNTFTLQLHDQPLPVQMLRPKLQSVLAYLLYRHPQVVTCAQLNDQFWPSSSSNNSVFNAISTLRQWAREQLPAPLLLTTRGGKAYRLSSVYALTSDFEKLQRWHRQSVQLRERAAIDQLLHQALACYTGRFGQDLPANDWSLGPAFTAEEQLAGIFRYACRRLREWNDHQAIIDWGLQFLPLAPAQEEVSYQLALAYQQSGWEGRALQQIQRCQTEVCSTRLRLLEQQLRAGQTA
ncbi:MAG: winged helix-turn-helix domain-containing protein [Lewinella sp.]|nr:winged helix-turn-helix domain-containing protein [Lewinella sp.]